MHRHEREKEMKNTDRKLYKRDGLLQRMRDTIYRVSQGKGKVGAKRGRKRVR